MTGAARTRLKRLRQGSVLAVALTALLLSVGEAPSTRAQDPDAATSALDEGDAGTAAATAPTPPLTESVPPTEDAEVRVSIDEATGTIHELGRGFFALLPKLAIALGILAVAWVFAKLVQVAMRRALGAWERTEAMSAIARILLFLLALSAAMSVVAGDARALVGSVGLVGLALSWALQTPIESFTGWLLNSLRGYYRVGDRIQVGDVFGDVYKIDVLTTTVWEAGGPGKAVGGAQATGAVITFPNWEVLRSNIVNYTREFPYVWDEITVSVGGESDLEYTAEVLREVAHALVGGVMQEPAKQYERLLADARLAFDVPAEPSVFMSSAEEWVDCTIRYLVPARERRRWASDLLIAVSRELAEPVHAPKIHPASRRTRVDLTTDTTTKLTDTP